MSRHHICENDWLLFHPRVRDELDVYFADVSSKLDVLTSVLSFILCVLGAASNFVHLMVLGSRYIPFTSVNRILFWIAACDLVTMLSCVSIYLGIFVHPKKECVAILGQTLGQVRWLLGHVFLTLYMHSVSLWLVVSMAFVRLMALRRVRAYSRWITPSRAKRIMWLVLVLLLPFCVPTLLLYEPQPTYMREARNVTAECAEQNGTRYWLQLRKFPELSEGQLCIVLKIHLWIFGTGCKVMPSVLLATLSVILLRRLHRQATSRKRKFPLIHTRSLASENGRSHREKRINIAVTSIVMIFFITELPQGILTVMSGVFTEDIYFHVYAWIGGIIDLLSIVNSSVNFVIMVATSSDYRQAFQKVVFCRRFRLRSRTRTAVTNGSLIETTQYGSAISVQEPRIAKRARDDDVWL